VSHEIGFEFVDHPAMRHLAPRGRLFIWPGREASHESWCSQGKRTTELPECATLKLCSGEVYTA